MTPNLRLLLPVAASLILLGLDATATLAQSEPPAAKPARHCFSLTRWNGGSNQLLMGDVHLINIARGGDMVCNPIDLDLFVSDNHGFKTPLFVKTITKLTPEQVAALPKTLHP